MDAVLKVFAEFDKTHRGGGDGMIPVEQLIPALKQIDASAFNDEFLKSVFGEGEALIDYTGFTAWVTGSSESKAFVQRPEEDDLEDMDMDTAMVDEMLTKARDKFLELDANGNGELDAKEMKVLCEWTFSMFGRQFKSPDEKKKAIEKQVKRYQKKGTVWDYDTFESYYLQQMSDIEQFQVKRSEAFQKGYKKSAAVEKFKELDVDGSGELEGKEIEVFAEWIFQSFHPDGKPLTEDQRKAEAQKLLKKLDSKKGNSDGKLSFVEVDFYIEEKIAQISEFKKKHAERVEKQAQKEKEKAEKKAAKEAEKAKKQAEKQAAEEAEKQAN